MSLRISSGVRLAGIAVGLALSAGAAGAQISPGHEPIQIEAATFDGWRDDGHGIYINNVDATQGDARLKADKLTLFCDLLPAQNKQPRSCGHIKEMIAEGNVYYVTPDGKIHGDRADYDDAAGTITVTSDSPDGVVLSRGDQGVSQGKKLIYKVQEGHATMSAGPNDRVKTIILQTDDKNGDKKPGDAKSGNAKTSDAKPGDAAPAATIKP